ncbi:DUF4004 family protein [Brevibacillus dissolubilis]|uniref:DUF4004 family protein n=1 Tax=Brevibacillus dissolubilis TaxID=1844116 RepID=UPI00111708D2|nr:DUF4004 family protein [Brevibacillus dissolubilis]
MKAEQDLISKKELLAITGISYGQLYRWKRQNLIPDAWFIKQSSFTGQETYFPRDKMLERINKIIELKDQYSLEDLAQMLSPELNNKTFTLSDIEAMPILDATVTRTFVDYLSKERFSFLEVLFIHLLGKAKAEYDWSGEQLEAIVMTVRDWLPKLNHSLYRLVICQKGTEFFALLVQQDADYHLDHLAKKLKVYDLESCAKELHPIGSEV